MDRLARYLEAEALLSGVDEAQPRTAEETTLAAQFAAEQGLAPDAMRRELARRRPLREALILRWAATQGRRLPAWWSQRHRLLRLLVVGLGLLLGLGTAQAVLTAKPGEPINLWYFLAILVFLQVLVVALALTFSLVAKARGRAWMSGFSRFLQAGARWLESRGLALDRLPPRPLTAGIETWACLLQTQGFAIAFNLGAIALFLARLLFSELQFAWSTTPDGGQGALLERMVQLLAAPWAWLAPASWVPDAAYLAGTRWDALAASFHNPALDGRGWWPFLLMSLLTWGLLPRLLLWTWLRLKLAQAMRQVSWTHRQCQLLFERLYPATAAATPIAAAATPATPTPKTKGEEARAIVLWGDWATASPAPPWTDAASPLTRLGLSELPRQLAGSGTPDTDEACLAALAATSPQEVWLLVEAGEAPDKRLGHFLDALRERLGAKLPLQLLPLEPGAATAPWPAVRPRDQEVWARSMAKRRDPYLRLLTLEAKP